MPVPPFPATPWLSLIGGGVALIVCVIAFLVASGLIDCGGTTRSARR